MQRRRIFKSRRSRVSYGRGWRWPVLLCGLGLIVALASGVGLPSDLMGFSPHEPDWVTGPADLQVVDGDTLRLRGRTLRLAGIEAPARGETCRDPAARSFDCGGAATAALSRLLSGQTLHCRVDGFDQFGRGLGRCDAGSTDVGRALVGGGWALAASGADAALQQQEADARRGGSGLWASGAVPPTSWTDR